MALQGQFGQVDVFDDDEAARNDATGRPVVTLCLGTPEGPTI